MSRILRAGPRVMAVEVLDAKELAKAAKMQQAAAEAEAKAIRKEQQASMAIAIKAIAKLLYEAIEEIDASQVEAVTATGASPSQVIDYAVVPQSLPAFAGICVFRWDTNIRESAVLGLVGAGGLGLALQDSLNVLAWPQVTVIFVLILLTVLVSEWVSARVRHAII